MFVLFCIYILSKVYGLAELFGNHFRLDPEQVELGTSLDCRAERDIFEALGLDYVPPHMRFFHDFE